MKKSEQLGFQVVLVLVLVRQPGGMRLASVLGMVMIGMLMNMGVDHAVAMTVFVLVLHMLVGMDR